MRHEHMPRNLTTEVERVEGLWMEAMRDDLALPFVDDGGLWGDIQLGSEAWELQLPRTSDFEKFLRAPNSAAAPIVQTRAVESVERDAFKVRFQEIVEQKMQGADEPQKETGMPAVVVAAVNAITASAPTMAVPATRRVPDTVEQWRANLDEIKRRGITKRGRKKGRKARDLTHDLKDVQEIHRKVLSLIAYASRGGQVTDLAAVGSLSS